MQEFFNQFSFLKEEIERYKKNGLHYYSAV